MTKLILITAAVVGIAYWMQADYNDAMAKCQINHSFDTCFYSLNH